MQARTFATWQALCARGLLALLAAAMLLLVWTPGMAQDAAEGRPADMVDRGTARLVLDNPQPAGGTLDAALVFVPDEGWHGYWSNPGDAGQGIELVWTLPAGWSAGEPAFPVPQTYVTGGLMNHVFEGEHALIVPLSVPPGTPPGSYPVEVFGRWLTCSASLCVPQRATLRAIAVVGPSGTPDAQFERWRAAIPPMLASEARFAWTPTALRLAIPLPAAMDPAAPHVFVQEGELVDYAAPQRFSRVGDTIVAEIPRKGAPQDIGQVTGIFSFGDFGFRFTAVPGDVPTGGTPIAGPGGDLTAPLWLLIGGALLGGLLLNVMPCVFPILSLKALSLAKAGGSEAEAQREGLAYTAGVVLACLGLGTLLLALRAGGSEIGWAFQLQSPGIVLALLALAVAITANLAGIYELPALSLTRPGGGQGAFATGLLAAFVATPCTGPFMAAALGAALVLPWWQALALFGALGLGLALPFLLLGFVPALRRMLPRPGAWMETFRRVLAIPMGLTALALLWLSWRIGGPVFAGLGLVLAAAVVAALVAWRMRKALLALVAIAIMAGASVMAVQASRTHQTGALDSILDSEPFSARALAEARASGQPVFVYFTADWCVTCKVNEAAALEREGVRDAFEDAGVIVLRGDWTREDPEITRFLTAQGVAGIPLYMWYPAGGEGEQLPQLLTQGMLVDLAQDASSTGS
ncbi:protein-disulfide reductase DsbD family protein [Paraurantiacibacter namhicola]|uniref:Thiol:disulfide interchange protein DsbD n=1 Tax=Paraurantiacibacter namhicola TaxID=645517 RepID=A0A1C7D7S7_9SPHN|nr:thioredoxin family protein [Paraurantiacibacter namhicola]ANU07371.1 Thiol:disulfide interchange protein DsbD precursor [Paraurantiacibacter namhicola]